MSQALTIQEIEDLIARARVIIENTTAQIPFSLNLIREHILNGASSGDPIKDLLYLLRTDAIASPGLSKALAILHAELVAHAREFIIVEFIDLIEVFHGGPHETSTFPPVEQMSYRVGIIPEISPLTTSVQNEHSETEGFLLKLQHTEPVELSTHLLNQLERLGDGARAIFAPKDHYEPDAIAYGDKRMRFLIGNNRVAGCLFLALRCAQTHARQLRRNILDIVDQLAAPIPHFEKLSAELSDPNGFFGESKEIAHAATS